MFYQCRISIKACQKYLKKNSMTAAVKPVLIPKELILNKGIKNICFIFFLSNRNQTWINGLSLSVNVLLALKC